MTCFCTFREVDHDLDVSEMGFLMIIKLNNCYRLIWLLAIKYL
jgi:hypothetical protein